MTQPSQDETKPLRTRLRPPQRTMALIVVAVAVAALAAVAVPTAAQSQTDNTLYVVEDGNVLAWDIPSDTARWNLSVSGVDFDDLQESRVSDRLYAGTQSGELYIIDKTDGSVLESVTVSSAGASVIPIEESADGGQVYVGESGEVRAFDSQTGVSQWNTSTNGDPDDLAVNPSNGDVYVATGNGGNYYALDESDGSVIWSVGDVAYSVAAADSGDEVYFGYSNKILAVDPSDGSERWTYTNVSSDNVLSVDAQDGRLYFPGGAIRTSDQTELWTRTVADFTYTIDSTEDGSAVFYSDSNDVFGVQSTTGSVLYQPSVQVTDVGISMENNLSLTTISGEVEDQRGQSVEGATVEAVNGSSTYTATTGEGGSYKMEVFTGTYNVTATKDGYVNDSVTDLLVSSDVTQDFTLIEEEFVLSVDARHYMEHGETVPYSVRYGEIDDSGNYVRSDVTNDTSVRSNDTSIVTVDTSSHELAATSDTSVNARTYVWFNYTNDEGETFSRKHNVTVANATVDNLDILPPVTKFTATLGDKTMQTILIATGVAVVAALLAGAFSGIAAFTVIMSMGWVMGIVDDGTIIVVVLTAAFIGMNVAGNVDYTVRR